jgi:hypothetical protein
MDEAVNIEDWRKTAEAAIWFPFRRAITRTFAEYLGALVSCEQLQRCLYLGFESPSVIDGLQRTTLDELYTSSSFDYWGAEADFWGDGPPSPYIRAFFTNKVRRVIEGYPGGIDFLYIDYELDETRQQRFAELLRPTADKSLRIRPKVILLADMQEPDGPRSLANIATKAGWFRIRVADGYPPHRGVRAPGNLCFIHICAELFSGGCIGDLGAES